MLFDITRCILVVAKNISDIGIWFSHSSSHHLLVWSSLITYLIQLISKKKRSGTYYFLTYMKWDQIIYKSIVIFWQDLPVQKLYPIILQVVVQKLNIFQLLWFIMCYISMYSHLLFDQQSLVNPIKYDKRPLILKNTKTMSSIWCSPYT